jgi:protein TonB
VEHYNVLLLGSPQPVRSLDGAGALRYPQSGSSTSRRAALAVSLLLHVMVACGVTLWLPRRSPMPPETEQPIEMVFQPPAEAAPELPQAPPVEPAPTPPEAPVPPAPQPVEAAPPAPLAPPPPPVEQAPAVPSVPTPVAPAVEQPEEAPKPPPKPSPPPARPQPHPIVRARPAAPQPAPSAASVSPPAALAPAPVEAPPAPISADWRQQLSAWLAAHKSYPEPARRRGEEGTVALRFAVERSGRVTEVSVARGSGSSILDAAAEAMLRNAVLPAFPGTMPQERVVVTVQLRFALTN